MNNIQKKSVEAKLPKSSVGDYFDAIGRFRLLSREEEIDLACRIAGEEKTL